MLLIANPVYALNEDLNEQSYEFPVTPESKQQWSEMENGAERVSLLQIPKLKLKTMSDSALIKTVLNYPLSIDLYVCDTFNEGFAALKEEFNGLDELSRRIKERPFDIQQLLIKEDKMINEKVKILSTDDFQMFYAKRVLSLLISESTNTVMQEMPEIMKITTATVKTPKGSSVPAYKSLTWADHGMTEAEGKAAHKAALKQYPNMTAISGPSSKYNCHSYAWYSTSTNNIYWIDNPSKYWTDGSYAENRNYVVGYKITYIKNGSITHSGIISSVVDRHLNGVKSKWGCLGVYNHPYFDVPTSYGNIYAKYIKKA